MSAQRKPMMAHSYASVPTLRSPFARFWVSHWTPAPHMPQGRQQFDTGFSEQRDAFAWYDRMIAAGHCAQIVELICEPLAGHVITKPSPDGRSYARHAVKLAPAYEARAVMRRESWWLGYFAAIKRIGGNVRRKPFDALYRARFPGSLGRQPH